jgi:hypothetical protein
VASPNWSILPEEERDIQWDWALATLSVMSHSVYLILSYVCGDRG